VPGRSGREITVSPRERTLMYDNNLKQPKSHCRVARFRARRQWLLFCYFWQYCISALRCARDLPGGDLDSEALATDEDGDVTVGRGHTDVGDEAFPWTQLGGMVDLKDALEGTGLDLTGWTLTDAVAVSADGLIINPNGFEEGWVASIPEPSTVAMALIGGLIGMGLAGRRR